MTQKSYEFGPGAHTYENVDPALVGGKGAGLIHMSNLGLPIPGGFLFTTEVCNSFEEDDTLDFLAHELNDRLMEMEWMGRLFSVRSGAPVSMPGMMDTVLNLGITSKNLPKLCKHMGYVAALDCYRRLIQMFGNVVMGIPNKSFDKIYDFVMEELLKGPTPQALFSICNGFLKLYQSRTGHTFPDSLVEQVSLAVRAVFKSWNSPRAISYRKIHGIPDDMGTACIVQAMVFGNLNEDSASGVVFTRNPATGESGLYGEFLPNAQGEDVVSGTSTPRLIKELHAWNKAVFGELLQAAEILENHFRDMQDIEFTVEDSKLYILQTRAGKRSSTAAWTIARDLYDSDLVSLEEMFRTISANSYRDTTRVVVDPDYDGVPAGQGLPVGGGMVSGVAVFTEQQAAATKDPYILIKKETLPEDLDLMHNAAGILTSTGGVTSHAAVVARAANKPCVVGCPMGVSMLGAVFATESEFTGSSIPKGHWLTIDGDTGRVWLGDDVPAAKTSESEAYKWAMEKFIKHLGGYIQMNEITFYNFTAWKGVKGLRIVPERVSASSLKAILANVKKLPKAIKSVYIDITAGEHYQRDEDYWLYELFGGYAGGEFQKIVPMLAALEKEDRVEWCHRAETFKHEGVTIASASISFYEDIDEAAFKLFKE